MRTIKCHIADLRESLLDLNHKLYIGENATIIINNPRGLYFGYFEYCGFKIKNIIDNKINISVALIKHTNIENIIDKKYSLFIKLPRTGKNSKRIYVYKLRTMQPYSEYIQDYVIEKNGFNEDGTIKNDFRITKIGKFLRKYWLDELPMLINWFKGDLKLIGVRPLSDTMLNTYPQEYVKERNQYKPGLIPPYYIDRPDSFEGIIESEKKYIEKYQKNGFKTDIIYFYKFLKAIFFKGVRSS